MAEDNQTEQTTGLVAMREKLESTLAENEQLREANEAFAQQARTADAQRMFRELGYPEEQAELYLSKNEGQPTQESVQAFASKFRLTSTTTQTQNTAALPVTPGPQIHHPGANPMAGAGDTFTPSPSEGVVTNEQLQELLASDYDGTMNKLYSGQLILDRRDSANEFVNIAANRQRGKPTP